MSISSVLHLILCREVVILVRFEIEQSQQFETQGDTQMHVKKGDTVEIMAGDDKGQRGTVLSVDHAKNRVVVEGVNRVFKHVRRGHPRSPSGGRLNLEMPIAASNVLPVCPQSDKPTRVGVRILDDGSKERYAKASGASMGQISPPKASRAKS